MTLVKYVKQHLIAPYYLGTLPPCDPGTLPPQSDNQTHNHSAPTHPPTHRKFQAPCGLPSAATQSCIYSLAFWIKPLVLTPRAHSLIASVMASAPVSVSVAMLRALTRFQDDGCNINPYDVDVQDAYMYLCNIQGRVDAQSLLSFIATRTSTIRTGAECMQMFWGVPKCNISVMTDTMKAALISEEQLRSIEQTSGCDQRLDSNKYYVFDQMIPRHELGMNVLTLGFFTGSDTTAVNVPEGTPGALPSAAAERLGALSSAAPERPGALPPAAPEQPVMPWPAPVNVPLRQAALRRDLSDPPSPTEEPHTKRRRLLKDTLVCLREDIIKCADQGNWGPSDNDNWDINNVSYLLNELIQVLNELKNNPDTRRFAKLVTNMRGFVTEVFFNRPSFAVLHKVVKSLNVLHDFARACVDVAQAGDLILLLKLAEHPTNEVAHFDMQFADVLARNQFCET